MGGLHHAVVERELAAPRVAGGVGFEKVELKHGRDCPRHRPGLFWDPLRKVLVQPAGVTTLVWSVTRKENNMLKILVAVDGSELSLDGVRHTLQWLQQGLQATVVLAHVQEPASLYELVTSRTPT